MAFRRLNLLLCASAMSRRCGGRRLLALLALGAFAAFGAAGREAVPLVRAGSIDLFRSGTEGYHTFRIPVLIASQRGTLLAFCEGRRDGIRDHGAIHLVLKRSQDGGRTWSPLQVVCQEPGSVTLGNPAPVMDPHTGRIVLLFSRNNNSVFVTHSDDDGASWAEPRNITRHVRLPHWEWYATGPSPGVSLRHGHTGRMVIPCNHSARLGGIVVGRAHAIYSDDGGNTWHLGQPVPLPESEAAVAAEFNRVEARARAEVLGRPAAEPAAPAQTPATAARTPGAKFAGNEGCLVELPDGTLMLNTRGGTRGSAPWRAVTRSRDGGVTWAPLHHHRDLIEPTCHADLRLAQHAGRPVLLFSNPAHPPGVPDFDTGRQRMTVKASVDGGRTWPFARLLHAGPSSYSSLTVLPDGTVLCLFEGGEQHRREWLRLARFPLRELVPE
jgi:sialidase-1